MPLSLVILLLLLLGVLLLVVRLTSQPMTREHFMSAVQRHVSATYKNTRIEPREDLECMLVTGGSDIKLSLEEAYDQYLRHPKFFTRVVDVFLADILKTLSEEEGISWEEAKTCLLPQVRPRDYLDLVRKAEGGTERAEGLLVFDLDIGLKVTMTIEGESERQTVTKADLKRWNISEDELKKCAVGNLVERTKPYWRVSVEQARKHGFFRFDTGDGYDAARFLLPDLYERVVVAVGSNRLAVIAPHRDLLAAFPAEEPDVLDRARKLASKGYQTGDHPISPNLFFLPKDTAPPAESG